jgi:hypothetical protein
MILYNVTVSLDPAIREEWLVWMRSTHIPDVMATGCFVESRISQVQEEDPNAATYAISYLSPSIEKIDQYRKEFAAQLQKDHTERYDGKFAAFRTILTVVEEFKSER